MKLRYILIVVVILIAWYYAYTMYNNQNSVTATIDKSEQLIATNSGLIQQAELTISSKLEENTKLVKIVQSWKDYLKAINDGTVVTSPQEDKWALEVENEKPQAPSESLTGMYNCTIDGENMEWQKEWLNRDYEFLETCWVFEDYKWCYIRLIDSANCFKQ